MSSAMPSAIAAPKFRAFLVNRLVAGIRDGLPSALCVGALASASPMAAYAAQDKTDTLERIEVTGSRLNRPDSEGAFPVTVINRQEIERSGAQTLADFLRSTTFNSFGSPRPTPLATQQSFAGMSIHGLDTKRTLILVDGHRLPTAPTVGSSQNLNNVPLSMVERIEILSDGASAIYGADAIGGVVNIITRHGFSGADISISDSQPSRPGADRSYASATFGINSERGQLTLGASAFRRTRVWARDRPWEPVGASSFSNTLFAAIPEPNAAYGYRPGSRLHNSVYGSSVPGNGCSANGFYTTGSGASTACSYDFNRVASIESDHDNTAVHGNGTLNLGDDWALHLGAFANSTHIGSTNASTPSSPWFGDAILIPVGSPNHPAVRFPGAGYDPNQPVFLRHRFAGVGNRELDTRDRIVDTALSVDGRAGDFDLRFGLDASDVHARMTGHNYVLRDIADVYIHDGRYDIYNPTGNSDSVLAALRTDIHRDSNTRNVALYGNARVDLGTLRNGVAQLAFGVDLRRESYADRYDPRVAANRVAGLSDSSSSGSRTSQAVYAEMLLPLWRGAELTLAGRYDHYSRFGGAFSPKLALRYQPANSLTLRASLSEGFAAPTLRNLNQSPSLFLSGVNHPETCASLGLGTSCLAEVETYLIGNAHLRPETSRQISAGFSWQPVRWFDLTVDAFHARVNRQEIYADAILIANCLNHIERRALCPRDISALSATAPRPQVGAGLGVAFGPNGEILYAQTGYANLGTIALTGFDLSANTRFELGRFGTLRNHLRFGGIGSYESNGTQSAGSVGKPDGRLQLSTAWERKTLVVAWNINAIGAMDSVAGQRAHAGQSDFGYGHRVPLHVTHDVQVDWTTPWRGHVTFGVQNATNRDPYIDPLNASYNTALYDGYGRVPYLRYTQSF